METKLNVIEYSTFNEAWENAEKSRTDFEAFQTGSKIALMKQYGKRFFVDENKELWYIIYTPEGGRFIHKAKIYSILSNSDLEYVQIMVLNGVGMLRFSGKYVNRNSAIVISRQLEVAAFC